VASSLGRITKTDGVIKNNGNLSYASEQIIKLAKSYGAIEILVGLPLDSVRNYYLFIKFISLIVFCLSTEGENEL
jgi:hypothetical protein